MPAPLDTRRHHDRPDGDREMGVFERFLTVRGADLADGLPDDAQGRAVHDGCTRRVVLPVRLRRPRLVSGCRRVRRSVILRRGGSDAVERFSTRWKPTSIVDEPARVAMIAVPLLRQPDHGLVPQPRLRDGRTDVAIARTLRPMIICTGADPGDHRGHEVGAGVFASSPAWGNMIWPASTLETSESCSATSTSTSSSETIPTTRS